jgi:hypothetical protein
MKLRITYFLSATYLITLALICSDYSEVAWALDSSAAGALSLAMILLAIAYFAAGVVATGLATGQLVGKIKLSVIVGAASALAFSSALPLSLLLGLESAPLAGAALAFALGLAPVLAYVLGTREAAIAAERALEANS